MPQVRRKAVMGVWAVLWTTLWWPINMTVSLLAGRVPGIPRRAVVEWWMVDVPSFLKRKYIRFLMYEV